MGFKAPPLFFDLRGGGDCRVFFFLILVTPIDFSVNNARFCFRKRETEPQQPITDFFPIRRSGRRYTSRELKVEIIPIYYNFFSVNQNQRYFF